MTPEQINIAIAKAQGWRHREGGMWYCPDGSTVPETLIPNYYNDLNAMHEVWCSLTEKQHQYFRRELQFVIAEAGDNNIPHKGPCHSVCNATALQRAEAYLRTIGKWND